MTDATDGRVCHLVQDLARGGVESLLVDLVAETSDSLSHAVGYLSEHDEMAPALRDAGATVTRLDLPWASPRTVFDPRSVRRTTRYLERVDPDVLHVHYPLYVHVLGRVAARWAGVGRVVGTYHNPARDFHPAMRHLERATRPLADATVGVSDAVTRTFADGWSARLPGFDPDGTVANGIDVDAFAERVAAADGTAVARERDIDPDDVVFLNVSRYADQKAQHVLVRAMDRLRERGVAAHLLLVGHGPREGDLRALVDERDLGDAVTVTGEVESVHEYYAAADAFALSSTYEGLAIVLLEAMAAELPVVATDVPGVGEVVEEGETGVLVPPDDPGALADGMARFTDPDRRERAGRRGRDRAREAFDTSTAGDAYEALYRR